jgi:hypothetical protein
VKKQGRMGFRVGPFHQRGGASVEYLIGALFVVVVLVANENVVSQLAQSIRNAYASFLYALSVSWF